MRLIALFTGLVTMAGLAAADMRVASGQALKAAVEKPQPEYSSIARQMKVAGRVEVEAVVNAGGRVESVRAVQGNPLLTQSAIAAVQKWTFTPFTAEGNPTRAIVNLNFDFHP